MIRIYVIVCTAT